MANTKQVVERKVQLRAEVRQIWIHEGEQILLYPGDLFPAPIPERLAIGLIRNHYASDAAADTEVVRPRRTRTYRRRDLKATE